MFRTLLGLFLVWSALALAQEDPVVNVSQSDPEMTQAINRAQQKLDLFIAFLKVPMPGQIYFSVKARFDHPNGGEHMWLENITFDFEKEEFTGVLANEPIYVKNLKKGDVVHVSRRLISDWMIVEKSSEGYRLLGGYTLRVLRDRMSPEERANFDRRMGLIIDEKGYF